MRAGRRTGAGEPLGRPVGAASRGGRGALRAVGRVRGGGGAGAACVRGPAPPALLRGPRACGWAPASLWREMGCEVGTRGDLKFPSRRWVAASPVLGSWIESRFPSGPGVGF